MNISTTPTNGITQNFFLIKSLKKLRNCSALEKENQDYEKLINSGMSMESTLTKSKLYEKQSIGAQTYQYLEQVRVKQKMQTSKAFAR